ncbi:MAG TPA: CheR family methyltransferase [Rhodopila sp.]|nr:CheR family methyltransferase [Rhodopila sp.]
MNDCIPGVETVGDPPTAHLLDVIERQAGLSRDAGLAERLVRRLPLAERRALAMRLDRLSWRDPDWQSLIAPLLVHETYLFRDWPQLEHLVQAGLPERIALADRDGRRMLRLWSAGCASGEEAYSLAAVTLMAMLRAGVAREQGDTLLPVAPWRLEVIGSDLSQDMVTRAERGEFTTAGLSPFRAMPAGYERFFPAKGPGVRGVRADLRAQVRFVQSNLLDGPAPTTGVDVAVCRNVLLYLTTAARRTALDALTSAIAPNGFLLLGPTDAPPPGETFDAIWSAGPVIYRRRP